MKDIIYVNTGELKFAKRKGILYSGAIGSCIVITMYDAKNQKGGMAHVMLPDRISRNKHVQHTRYASNAIEKLVKYFFGFTDCLDQIETCLVGGGNVLQREDDMVCTNNILSVNEELFKCGIEINTPTKEAAKAALDDFAARWEDKYSYAIKAGGTIGKT